MIIEFDRIKDWGPLIRDGVLKIAPPILLDNLRRQKFRFQEDAFDFVSRNLEEEAIFKHIADHLSPHSMRLYHGTRLNDAELANVRSNGLEPLSLNARRAHLISTLKCHSKWTQESELKIDVAMSRMHVGCREDGCVHACFSRYGLMHGCNHYLQYGAEVDGIVAAAVVGDSAERIFRTNRRPYLISFVLPFLSAVDAAKGFGSSYEAKYAFLKYLIRLWAHWEVRQDFSTTRTPDGIAARHSGRVTADNIETIVELRDSQLWRWKYRKPKGTPQLAGLTAEQMSDEQLEAIAAGQCPTKDQAST